MLHVEQLESRDCPAATLINGTLFVLSDGGAVAVTRAGGVDTVVEDGVLTGTFASAAVQSATVTGSDKVDVIQITGNLPATISTGGGDDVVFVGTGAAFVDLGRGKDVGYAILSATTIKADDGLADLVFVNPTGTAITDAKDQTVTFFRPGRTPGVPSIGVEADGVLYVTLGNLPGSFKLEDAPGKDAYLATYDLGDGLGTRQQTFIGVQAVSFFGGAANDTYVNNTKLPEAAYGSGGDDFLSGSRGKLSILKGLGGNDTLVGNALFNDLSGNGGADALSVARNGKHFDVFRVDALDFFFAGAGDFVLSP
jgi:hypothetical protein